MIQADVRVLAATNRNLEQAISEGSFREDLYHRLNVVTIQIPPLRDRRGDIPKLVDYFLDRYSSDLNIDRPPVSDEASQELFSYAWPGNVRELEYSIYRTLIFTRGFPIQADDVCRARDSANMSGGGSTRLGAQERCSTWCATTLISTVAKEPMRTCWPKSNDWQLPRPCGAPRATRPMPLGCSASLGRLSTPKCSVTASVTAARDVQNLTVSSGIRHLRLIIGLGTAFVATSFVFRPRLLRRGHGPLTRIRN